MIVNQILSLKGRDVVTIGPDCTVSEAASRSRNRPTPHRRTMGVPKAASQTLLMST